MTRMKSTFADSFWDSDICGTLGWDRLCKRMKDGRKVCSDVTHFFKERAKAEQDYSKALSNLARKADGKDETGGLGESWRNLKMQTQKMAEIHEEAAQMFTGLEAELARFNDEQKRNKSQIEDNVKKYMTAKKNDHQKVVTLKKSYEEKCKDFNISDENLITAKRAVTTKKGDLEKLEHKRIKCSDARENADTAYKSSLQSLESSRQKWEQETEAACNQFEALEMSRIDTLRDLMWKCTNVESNALVKHDDCCEAVRKVLEKCDITNDIQDFIESNKSGSKRPDEIHYENYYNMKGLPSRSALAPPPNRTKVPPSPTARKNTTMPDDDLYATVREPGSVNPSNLVKVVRPYMAVNFNELSVEVGDLVEVKTTIRGKPPPDGHILAKRGNRIGLLPKECVGLGIFV